MRISAVITSYNYAHFLGRSVVSALTQTAACEVVVVDDGSTDETPAVMERLRRMYARRELRYLRIANAGPSAARNAGARAAQGEWLAFLDADDHWYPHKIAAQAWFTARHRAAALTFAGVDMEDAAGYRRRRLPPWEGQVSRDDLLCENLVPSPTPFVRRDVLLSSGGYDEGRRHGEDWDLWLRIAERAGVFAQQAVLACYRDHGGGLHNQAVMARGSREVLEAALARRPPPPALARRARAALGVAGAAGLAAKGEWRASAEAGLRSLAHDWRLAPRLAAGYGAAALQRAGG